VIVQCGRRSAAKSRTCQAIYRYCYIALHVRAEWYPVYYHWFPPLHWHFSRAILWLYCSRFLLCKEKYVWKFHSIWAITSKICQFCSFVEIGLSFIFLLIRNCCANQRLSFVDVECCFHPIPLHDDRHGIGADIRKWKWQDSNGNMAPEEWQHNGGNHVLRHCKYSSYYCTYIIITKIILIDTVSILVMWHIDVNRT